MNTTKGTTIEAYDPPQFNRIVLITFFPCILITNGFILLAFITSKKLREILTNYFVFSYACCDFLVGALVIPTLLFATPNTVGAVLMYSIMVSLLILLFCTYDRYIAVTAPFVYLETANKFKVIAVLMFAWLFPIFVAALPSAWLNRSSNRYSKLHRVYLGIIAFSIILITAISMVAYAVIFRIGRKHFAAMSKTEPAPDISQRGKRVLREVKFVKLYAFLSLTFIVFWLPTGYLNIVDDVFKKPNLRPPVWFVDLSSHWFLLSSVINPFIYGLFQKRFRIIVKHWFRWLPGCFHENRVRPDLLPDLRTFDAAAHLCYKK